MIGVGIVGCNYGRTVLLPAFRTDPRCEVVALAGSDGARTAELARAAEIARGFGDWLTASQAIGYAEMARHVAGGLSLDEAVAGTVKRTKALARRQLAWFRRDPRIRWFEVGGGGAMEAVDDIVEYLRT